MIVKACFHERSIYRGLQIVSPSPPTRPIHSPPHHVIWQVVDFPVDLQIDQVDPIDHGALIQPAIIDARFSQKSRARPTMLGAWLEAGSRIASIASARKACRHRKGILGASGSSGIFAFSRPPGITIYLCYINVPEWVSRGKAR
jgi:hypothetical protein